MALNKTMGRVNAAPQMSEREALMAELAGIEAADAQPVDELSLIHI